MSLLLSLEQVCSLFTEPTAAWSPDSKAFQYNAAWTEQFSAFAHHNTPANSFDAWLQCHFPDEAKHFLASLKQMHADQSGQAALTISGLDKRQQSHKFALQVSLVKSSEEKNTYLIQLDRRQARGHANPNDKFITPAAFNERIEKALTRCNEQSTYQFAVLLLDIDQFRFISDQMDKPAISELLDAVREKLSLCIRGGDFFTETDTNQYGIFVDQVTDPSHILRFAERVQETIRDEIIIDDKNINMTLSIGISLGNVGHESAEHVMRDADVAMYRAKVNGKGRYEIFDRTQYEHSIAILELERDIRLAFDKEQFSMLYEPILNLNNNQVEGVIPRLHWNHPKYGALTSDDFLNLAENHDLIESISEFRINNGCMQLSNWRENMPKAAPNWVNIPIRSPKALTPDLIDQLLLALQHSGLDASDVAFTFSPKSLLKERDAAQMMLQQIKALDIRVGLNQFGDSQASILDLHRYPFDFVMTSPELVIEPQGLNAIQSIHKLTSGIGIELIVTGCVEEHIQPLKDLGIGFAMGDAFKGVSTSAELGEYLDSTKQVA